MSVMLLRKYCFIFFKRAKHTACRREARAKSYTKKSAPMGPFLHLCTQYRVQSCNLGSRIRQPNCQRCDERCIGILNVRKLVHGEKMRTVPLLCGDRHTMTKSLIHDQLDVPQQLYHNTHLQDSLSDRPETKNKAVRGRKDTKNFKNEKLDCIIQYNARHEINPEYSRNLFDHAHHNFTR